MCIVPPKQSTCPRCAASFECGVDDGSCWCASVTVDATTRASFSQFYRGCLCPACLRELEDSRPGQPSVRAFLASQLRRKYGRRSD